MRKFLPFIILLFVHAFSFAQTALDAVLQGTIINAKQNYLELKYLNNPLDDTLSSVRIELNEMGQFYFELPIKRPLEAKLFYINQQAPLYIEPEERIEITALADDLFRSINYISKNFNNLYLVEYQKKYEKQRNIAEREKHILNDAPAQYAKYEDSLANDKLNFLDNYHAQNPLSTTFIRRQKARILYGAANNKYLYPEKYKSLSRKEKELQEEYYTFLISQPVNENDLITVPEFYEFLEHLFNYHFKQKSKGTTNEFELAAFEYNTAYGLYKERVKNIFLTKKFGEILDRYPYEYSSRFISGYMSTVYQTEYRAFIDKKIEQAIARKKN